MARTLYCWRCKIDVPMLEDHEWKRVHALFANSDESIERYRDIYNVSLAEATAKGYAYDALALYESLTGYYEPNFAILMHHRVSLYGPPCRVCGKPLRTPRATRCVECGAMR